MKKFFFGNVMFRSSALFLLFLASQIQTITNIKLKNSSGDVLSEAVVYVPLLEDVLMKHTITVKEEIEQ